MRLRSPSSLVAVVVAVVQVLFEPVALALCEAPDDPCPTTLDCTVCETPAGGNLPDPEDCHRYYPCLNNVDPPSAPLTCEGNQKFDHETEECSLFARCITCSQECVFDCSTSPDYFSSLSNCKEYYECKEDGGAVGPNYCDDETPFFDGKTCQTDETLCCRCQPLCGSEAGYIIDPLDCRKFWVCRGDPIELDGSGNCDPGEVFNTVIGDCSPTSKCETTCPNVVNTDGCIDPFTCLSTGYFAKCPNLCVNEYYYCEDVTDVYQEPVPCPTGTMFHPDTYLCVNPTDCPYPQPEFLQVTH